MGRRFGVGQAFQPNSLSMKSKAVRLESLTYAERFWRGEQCALLIGFFLVGFLLVGFFLVGFLLVGGLLDYLGIFFDGGGARPSARRRLCEFRELGRAPRCIVGNRSRGSRSR